MAQESEARESFEQLEMLKRTHDRLRTRAEELDMVNERLFCELEIIKKALMVSTDLICVSLSSRACERQFFTLKVPPLTACRTARVREGDTNEGPLLCVPSVEKPLRSVAVCRFRRAKGPGERIERRKGRVRIKYVRVTYESVVFTSAEPAYRSANNVRNTWQPVSS